VKLKTREIFKKWFACEIKNPRKTR